MTLSNNLFLIILLSAVIFSKNTHSQNLNKFIEEYIQKNKAILSAQKFYQAQGSIIKAASHFEAPILGANYSNMPLTSPILGKHPMSNIGISLTQKFWFFGTSRARTEVSKQESQTILQNIRKITNKQVELILLKLARLSYFAAQATLISEHIKNITQMQKVLTARYQVNKASQFELLRLDILLKESRQKQISENTQKSALQQKINSLLFRENLESTLPDGLIIQNQKIINLTPLAIHEAIKSNSPEYIESQKTSAVFDKKALLENKLAWPSFTLSANYKFRSQISQKDEGQDFIGLGIKIPLTFIGIGARNWRKKDSFLLVRDAHLYSSQHILLQKISAAIAEQKILKKYLQILSSYKLEIIPLTKQALSSSQLAYEVGKAQFNSIFETQKEIINTQSTALKHNLLARQSEIKLHALLGLYSDLGANHEN